MGWLLREAWTTVHSSRAMNSKKEIIKQDQRSNWLHQGKSRDNFSEEGLTDEHIVVKVDWEWIVNRVIIAAIIIATGLWALWRTHRLKNTFAAT